MVKQRILTAVLHEEEGMYIAECPEVGTFRQGTIIKEAVNNLKEATELYLEEFPLEKEENCHQNSLPFRNDIGRKSWHSRNST